LKAVKEAFADQQQTLEARYNEVQGWKQELRNDPNFGGAQWDKTITDARWALDQLGTADEVKRV
jgi:hypothetical protein